MLEFTFTQFQNSLFLTSIDLSRVLKLAVTIQEASGGLFDADPILLPAPRGAPPEIPRLVMQSEKERSTLQLSARRLDFVCRLPSDKPGTTVFAGVAASQANIMGNIMLTGAIRSTDAVTLHIMGWIVLPLVLR